MIHDRRGKIKPNLLNLVKGENKEKGSLIFLCNSNSQTQGDTNLGTTHSAAVKVRGWEPETVDLSTSPAHTGPATCQGPALLRTQVNGPSEKAPRIFRSICMTGGRHKVS